MQYLVRSRVSYIGGSNVRIKLIFSWEMWWGRFNRIHTHFNYKCIVKCFDLQISVDIYRPRNILK